MSPKSIATVNLNWTKLRLYLPLISVRAADARLARQEGKKLYSAAAPEFLSRVAPIAVLLGRRKAQAAEKGPHLQQVSYSTQVNGDCPLVVGKMYHHHERRGCATYSSQFRWCFDRLLLRNPDSRQLSGPPRKSTVYRGTARRGRARISPSTPAPGESVPFAGIHWHTCSYLIEAATLA
jgi:hypothetical protein